MSFVIDRLESPDSHLLYSPPSKYALFLTRLAHLAPPPGPIPSIKLFNTVPTVKRNSPLNVVHSPTVTSAGLDSHMVNPCGPDNLSCSVSEDTALSALNQRLLSADADWIQAFRQRWLHPPHAVKQGSMWVLAADLIDHMMGLRKFHMPVHIRMYPSGPLGSVPLLVYKLLSLEVSRYLDEAGSLPLCR